MHNLLRTSLFPRVVGRKEKQRKEKEKAEEKAVYITSLLPFISMSSHFFSISLNYHFPTAIYQRKTNETENNKCLKDERECRSIKKKKSKSIGVTSILALVAVSTKFCNGTQFIDCPVT